MANKIDKLNELHELFKSGAISQQEFDELKSEILNSEKATFNSVINETKTPIQKNVNKEKVSLKSFADNEGNRIQPPDIQYLNLKDLSDKEIKILKPFIKQKQIHSPSEMTSDEISIGNKIFSTLEIAEMNSERPGFNYAFMSILSVLCGAGAIYAITISPCFIYLGAGTGGLATLFISFFVFNKADSTKLDKIFCGIAIIEIIIAVIMFNKAWPS